MKKYLKDFINLTKLKKHNVNFLKKTSLNKDSKNLVLIEFNSFTIIHIIFSYISNFFLNKGFKINCFYSHILLSYDLKSSLKQKILRFISPLLNLGFFGLYKSFGVSEFIFPKISKNILNNANKKYEEIFLNLKNKSDILDIKIEGVYLGDIIYDSYLTRTYKKKPTIDISSKDFNIFLKDFLKLFYFWSEYFSKNQVEAVITSHSCYTMGIPLRIGLNKKAICLEIKENKLKRHTNKNVFFFSETLKYKNIFSSFSEEKKIKAKQDAKNLLIKRFEGKTEDIPYVTNSAFSLKKNFKLSETFPDKTKIKVLILPHDFVDAPHAGGLFPFADMYDWMSYLSKISKKTNYQWFLKTHPRMNQKWEYYQNLTRKFINDMVKDSNITILDANTSHNELIEFGIDIMLTIFGTAAHEYAFKKVKVINGGYTNPHVDFNFNLNIKNFKEYDHLLNNLDKVDFKIDEDEIYQFYFMHYVYTDKNWFFEDYDKLLDNLDDYHSQYTSEIYSYWVDHYDKGFLMKFNKNFENFLKSNDLVFSKKHQLGKL
jgi:hypothetical protein